MANVIFITSRLDDNHGGLTSSMLNKARILYDEKNLSSIILTFHADTNFNNVKSSILERYNLKGKVFIYNINEYFKEKNLTSEKTKYKIDTSIYTSIKINENKYEFYKDGLKKLEVFYSKNQIKEVKHFSENNICTSKDVIDNDGYMYWQSYYLDNYLSRQVFFKKDQTPFLTREFDAINKSDKITSLVLFEKKPLRFNSFNKFKEYFIDYHIKAPITYLVVEARGLDPVIMNIKNDYVRKIFMTHSIHIRPDTDIIRAGNRKVLENLNEIDALVLLTEKQKKDIKKRFGHRNNYYVIPHSIATPELKQEKVNNKVVVISRLHPEKRLDHSIKAFEKVIKKVPDAKLHIYGDGQEKSNLQSLINKLGLQDNVKLMGYSKEVNKILQSADCSLLTSKYEGFALVVQESIANATPVIAYDIKYGPSDMINNDINGYLVENNNINELSNCIIKYLNKSKKDKNKYCDAAIKKASDFSNQRFANSWIELFDNLKIKSDEINPTAKLIDLKHAHFNKLKYRIRLEVKLDSKSDIEPIFNGNVSHRSTTENQETKIVDSLNTKVLSSEKDVFKIEIDFDAKLYEKREIYDISISIKNKDKFFNIRIGDKEKKIKLDNFSHRKCKPFYTEKHSNLSFEL